jgi:hypothetical protein
MLGIKLDPSRSREPVLPYRPLMAFDLAIADVWR